MRHLQRHATSAPRRLCTAPHVCAHVYLQNVNKVNVNKLCEKVNKHKDWQIITELNRGRMFESEKVLLVLVCEVHFWVSCFLYALEICCLPFLQNVLPSWGIKVKKTKTCFFLSLSCLAF